MKSMKIFFKVAGIFLALFIGIALVVPFLIDVDKYRPMIEEQANSKINGKLELGKLSLSLWGQIRVAVGGLSLKDSSGRKIIAVKESYFHIPFSSVLGGAPLFTFKMEQPEVHVTKDKLGKLNVMTLVGSSSTLKNSKDSEVQQNNASNSTTSGSGSPAMASTDLRTISLPGIVLKARFGIELNHTLLSYIDEATALRSEVKDLNIAIKDISLSRATSIEIWADLNTVLGTSLSLKGPFRISGTAEPKFTGAELNEVIAKIKANFDAVEISVPGLFFKSSKIPMNMSGTFKTNKNDAQIEDMELKFFNAIVKVTGSASQLTQATGGAPSYPTVLVDIKSNEIDLSSWADLIPMLQSYKLGGSASFWANVKGQAAKLDYKAQFSALKVTAQAPHLKAKPEIDLNVKIITDQIESLIFTFKAPSNDLRVQGKLVSFTQPKADFQVSSTGMDLDQLIEFPKPDHKEKGEAVKKSETAATQEGLADSQKTMASVKETDYDSMLEPIRKNQMLGQTAGLLSINIPYIKAYGVKISDISGKFAFKELTTSIDSFNFKVFGGTIKSSFALQMRPKVPVYSFKTDVNQLDIQAAVKSNLELFKNTLLGLASFKMEASGSSLNTTLAKQNLKAKGGFKVEKATFATVDIGKMTSEAINKGLEKIGEKVPQAKGKGIKSVAKESRYEYISSDFAVIGSRFSAPNFVAKAEANQGIDLKGSTEVGIVDLGLKARWEVIDTYNFTQARDLSVEANGIKVDHILADGANPVKFPVTVGCKVMAPCYSYTEVPEYLASIAVKNVGSALSGKAKGELQKKINELAKKAPAPAQKAIENITKKLFGR